MEKKMVWVVYTVEKDKVDPSFEAEQAWRDGEIEIYNWYEGFKQAQDAAREGNQMFSRQRRSNVVHNYVRKVPFSWVERELL